MHRFICFLVATSLAGLAGCASEVKQHPCPPAGSVAGVERMTTFRPGGGEDLTDVLFDAEVAGVDSVCEYDEKGVDVAMNVRLIAERGPADTTRTAPFQYFVAVENGPGNITAKQIYDVALPFEGNRRRVLTIEQLDVTIPRPADDNFADIRILVGLQITAEQLDYNKRVKRR